MLRLERQCNRLHGRAASPAHHEFITAVTAVNYYKWIPQFQSWIHHLCNSSAADLLGSVEDGWVSWTMSHYFQQLNLTNYKLRFASSLSSRNFDILSPSEHSSSTVHHILNFEFYLIIWLLRAHVWESQVALQTNLPDLLQIVHDELSPLLQSLWPRQ